MDNSNIHIAKITHDEYILRAKEYLLEGVKKLPDEKNIQEFSEIIDNHNWGCCRDFINPQFSSQMQIEVNGIVEQLIDKASGENLLTPDFKKYWNNNYFSRTSVILKKSSIPYIF